jgi:hypothetical protein
VLGLGWPASFGFVVGPSPIVWSVSVSALMSPVAQGFLTLTGAYCSDLTWSNIW